MKVSSLGLLGLSLVVGAGVARAQTQVRPRVLIVIDTSGSMTGTFDDRKTHADGTWSYYDPSMQTGTSIQPAPGFSTGTSCPSPTNFSSNLAWESRAAVAKRAITNVVDATGDIDWGLMRFTATQCATSNTLVFDNNAGVAASTTVCTSDYDCGDRMYCVQPTGTTTAAEKRCRRPANLCADPNYGNQYELARPASSDDGATCTNTVADNAQHIRASYSSGGCGTNHTADIAGYCGSVKTCTSDADCGGAANSCQGQMGKAYKMCKCGTCPTGYACDASGFCRYNEDCRGETDTTTTLLVDTGAANGTTQILQWNNGNEVWGASGPTDPELRFINGGTPIGGALRTAELWYSGITDSAKTCRPYSVVLLTDGEDNCEGNTSRGPVAAAEKFVASTVDNARVANRVYVIGIAASTTLQTVLNNVAKAGGTNAARFSNNQSDIEAGLADVISESILFEKCNGIDDDCDGLIDEGFGIYQECTLGSPNCNAGRVTCGSVGQPACATGYTCQGGFCTATCTAGQGICQRTGVRLCQSDAAACSVSAGAPGNEATSPCNKLDDDCNGIVDDCTPGSPDSCSCSGVCVPVPETCNNKDDDCVGGVDNNPIDVGLPCGTGACAGTTVCQAGGNLVCNGPSPTTETCDGIDNDCDGIVDSFTEPCPPKSGQCDPGVRTCTAGVYSACTGIVNGTPEVCDGNDNDCNGATDDNPTDSWLNMDCCPTGNLADCCKPGKYQCVAGGKKCEGAVLLGPEVCDGVDNDCNSVVDDVTGIGGSCTDPSVNTTGTCKAEYVCTGTPGTGPKGLTCQQTVGPSAEVCDGQDNDCDGTADNNITTATDPRIGVEGGAPCMALPDGQKELPCMPGTTACVGGEVVCQGYVGPQPNLCDGVSRDCTGMANTNGDCPAGFECYQGNCVTPCSQGEFPCLGGFVCDPTTLLCIPDVCNKAMCDAGLICELGADGSATCVDPCKNTTCPDGSTCSLGVCKVDNCTSNGCPDGQICQKSGTETPACVDDPCLTAMCADNEYCDPSGQCVRICEDVCLQGTVCINGVCTIDPCSGKNCPAGQTCIVQGDTGTCVESLCGNDCGGTNRVCCGATCRPDPCQQLSCAAGSTCQLDPSCAPQCVSKNKGDVKIVPAGGGGVGCAVGGDGTGAWGLIFAVTLALVGVRRRNRSVDVQT